jgi:hypothetical protein
MNENSNNQNNINYSTYNPQGAQVLQQTGANYVEQGTTPHHIDTSSLDKKKKSPVLLIILFLIIIIFGIWAFLVYQDYGRVKEGKAASYCWFGSTHTEYVKSDSYKGYEGTIDTCTGPGYKVVIYKTVAFKVTEFVPVWEKTKTLDEVAKASK